MIDRLYKHLWKLRKNFSRRHWSVRLLRDPRCYEAEAEPGVVILQIDGLSYTQFQKALKNNNLPFIRWLVEKEPYTVLPFYSGMPSATPAVQGEIFFGVKTAVPAFEFVHRETGDRFAMYLHHPAEKTAESLEKKGAPLLTEGASYSNVFVAGAAQARYCAETLSLESLFKSGKPFRTAFLLMIHFTKLLRIAAYASIELLVALSDFFQGIMERKNFFKELKFIPARISICIILRELIRFHVKMDVTQGIRTVHANLIGYDEQAHRRGPSSAFAHWTLKGIDDVIKDIYMAARQSECRDYRIVIFSDHGQEAVNNFEPIYKTPVKKAVERVLSEIGGSEDRSGGKNIIFPDYLSGRARYMLFRRAVVRSELETEGEGRIEVTAMGPLGHVYLPGTAGEDRKKDAAGRLVSEGHIPLVFFVDAVGSVRAVNAEGEFDLTEEAARVLGADHPFLAEVAGDLKTLCCHRDAGDLVISGWTPSGRPVSFAIESGAHGGPGSEETRGFAVLPTARFAAEKGFVRGLDLRAYVQGCFSRAKAPAVPGRSEPQDDPGVRILSYNIHSGINMNGRVFPERAARVIAEAAPDIVALQEVDADMKRTFEVNQAALLADRLQMAYRFFPVIDNHMGQYGLALLSRYPIFDCRFDLLPGYPDRCRLEKRGVLTAKVKIPAGTIRLLNTHLSFKNRECLMQTAALSQSRWVKEARIKPSVLCGDLNAGPRSPAYRNLTAFLQDVQLLDPSARKLKPTYLSWYPVMRIDHILVSRHFRSLKVETPSNYDARMASDHLPVVAELCLKREAAAR